MRPRLLPTLLTGLLGAGGTALAAGRDLAEPVSDDEVTRTAAVVAGSADLPLAQALALVTLACWGVVLVSRGFGRRVVAGLGLLAALGALMSVVLQGRALSDSLSAELSAAAVGADADAIRLTWWYWVALAAAALSVMATAVALAAVPTWSQMGRRYDAPGASHPSTPQPGQANSTDLWRAMDEGSDPTA